MPLLNRHSIHIYYETHGSGRPLLLSHGYSASSEMWRDQIPFLSKHFKLIIWDMRGHGKSDYPENPEAYSEEHTVDDMGAILDQVCGNQGLKAIVGGLSLGGYMSMAFYRMFPERVLALLIIDTGPGFKKDSAREEWNAKAEGYAQLYEREGLEPLKKQSKERSPVFHQNAKGLVLAARGMLARKDSVVIDSLPRIKVPSLVVVGEWDKPFLAASEYMAKMIPGAKKVVVPRAGHAVNMDNPHGFEKAVAPFLEEFGSPRATL